MMKYIAQGYNPKSEQFKIRIHTVDKHNPKSICLSLKGWMKFNEDVNPKKAIQKLNKAIRNHLYLNANKKVFDITRTLVIIREQRTFNEHQPTFLDMEVVLYQHPQLLPFNSAELKAELDNVLQQTISVLNKDKHTKFTRTKNETDI